MKNKICMNYEFIRQHHGSYRIFLFIYLQLLLDLKHGVSISIKIWFQERVEKEMCGLFVDLEFRKRRKNLEKYYVIECILGFSTSP